MNIATAVLVGFLAAGALGAGAYVVTSKSSQSDAAAAQLAQLREAQLQQQLQQAQWQAQQAANQPYHAPVTQQGQTAGGGVADVINGLAGIISLFA